MTKSTFDLSSWADKLLEHGESQARKENRSPVAYFCSYVPEEILSVPGLYGYRMRTSNTTTTEIADSYLGIFNCSYTRCMFEALLDHDTEWLKGYVFTASCDHLRRLYDNLRFAAKPDFCRILDLPHKRHEDAREWYAKKLASLRDDLAGHFSVSIGNAELKQAIAECNETRRLISAINDLRKMDPPPLTGEDMQRIMQVAFSLPKSIVNPALAEILQELTGNEIGRKFRARVMLMGSTMDDPEYIAAIEERGALVVADSYCCGSLQYIDPVETNGDPIMAISRRYLDKIPCPRMYDDFPARYKRVKEAARGFGVHGIIIQSMKFCDIWGIEANVFLNNLREEGFHILRLEREYTLSGVGQLRTRVQAFLESMGM